MTSNELETLLNPIINYLAPVLFILTLYLAYKYKPVRYIVFGYIYIFVWIVSKLNGSSSEGSTYTPNDVDDNNADPNKVGTIAFYRKQHEEE